MYICLGARYTLFLSDFIQTWVFLNGFSKNTQISNFMNILSVGAELFHADRHDEAKNRFRHFVNASKNDTDTFWHAMPCGTDETSARYSSTASSPSHQTYHLESLYFDHTVTIHHVWGRDSSVGISTPYGLDRPGIESRGGENFHTPPDWSWGPPSLLRNGYRVPFPGVKQPGSGVNHPPISSDEVKERVELYLYFTSGT